MQGKGYNRMSFIINNHKIKYNRFFKLWNVSYNPKDKNDQMFGYPCGSFKKLSDAITEAING
jgi:hypothetical protein